MWLPLSANCVISWYLLFCIARARHVHYARFNFQSNMTLVSWKLYLHNLHIFKFKILLLSLSLKTNICSVSCITCVLTRVHCVACMCLCDLRFNGRYRYSCQKMTVELSVLDNESFSSGVLVHSPSAEPVLKGIRHDQRPWMIRDHDINHNAVTRSWWPPVNHTYTQQNKVYTLNS